MHRYTIFFITVNALRVSGGLSAHHQELKTVHTASGICRASLLLLLTWVSLRLTHVSSSKQASSTYTRCCVYSFELLMMGGETA